MNTAVVFQILFLGLEEHLMYIVPTMFEILPALKIPRKRTVALKGYLCIGVSRLLKIT
jgi:hypothetical protein